VNTIPFIHPEKWELETWLRVAEWNGCRRFQAKDSQIINVRAPCGVFLATALDIGPLSAPDPVEVVVAADSEMEVVASVDEDLVATTAEKRDINRETAPNLDRRGAEAATTVEKKDIEQPIAPLVEEEEGEAEKVPTLMLLASSVVKSVTCHGTAM